MTEKLLSEEEIKELEDESIALWEEGPLGITKDLLRDLDRALATIRAQQEREKLLMDAATDDVGAWRTVSEHIRVLQQRNEDMRVNLDRACAQRDALQAREGRLREKAERAAAAYSGAASRADKASAKALSYKQEADDLRAKLDKFRKGVVDIAKQRNQAKTNLDNAAKLIRETIPYFPRVGQIPEHGVRDRLMTFLSTLEPKPDTKEECDGSGNVEFGTCPGCPKCRPCKECDGSGIKSNYAEGEYTCRGCLGSGVEPGEAP